LIIVHPPSFVRLSKTDDADAARRFSEDQGVEPFPQEPHRPVSGFPIVFAVVYDDPGRSKLKLPSTRNGQTPQFDIPGIFRRIEFNVHLLIVSPKNKLSRQSPSQ
jgi:hypothetical protein